MANLTPTAGWDNVIQLETTTKAKGGVGGSMNMQAQALLNRTEVLKTSVDTLFTNGTFLPIVQGTTTAGTGTYTLQTGKYTKFGNVITFTCQVTWTAHTGTGNIKVNGLPSVSSATGLQPIIVVADAMTAPSGSSIVGMVNTSDTAINIYSVTTGVMAALAMDTAATLRISGSYLLD